jgi:gas vesicle protein
MGSAGCSAAVPQEYDDMRESRHNVAFMCGIILGALIAAAAVLLQTPLSGKETREQLALRLDALRSGGTE